MTPHTRATRGGPRIADAPQRCLERCLRPAPACSGLLRPAPACSGLLRTLLRRRRNPVRRRIGLRCRRSAPRADQRRPEQALQNAAKSHQITARAPRGPQIVAGGRRTTPKRRRTPQNDPKAAQNAAERPPKRRRTPQDDPKSLQNAAKRPQSVAERRKMTPNHSKGSKRAPNRCRRPQNDPKAPQNTAERPQSGAERGRTTPKRRRTPQNDTRA